MIQGKREQKAKEGRKKGSSAQHTQHLHHR